MSDVVGGIDGFGHGSYGYGRNNITFFAALYFAQQLIDGSCYGLFASLQF
ncbi:MAG: hypothetical protein BWX77_00083 [Bacteroidetes bacterium ADurb.Bin090]|nr:MAG: hypothetical protein BWX77_00083 [Bacteroidetes bacterium ADurb.Bin090]